MFFFGLIVFLGCAQFLPWWAACVVAAALGAGMKQSSVMLHFSLALAAGIANTALAFYSDGRHFGLISQRMSGLFSMPSPYLVFVLVFALPFILVFLWLRAGVALKYVFKSALI